jgi:hypothetical protein
MERNWTVYKHTFPNGKVYIGITGKSIEERWKDGFGYICIENGRLHQPLMAKAIVKYGWSNILHEIVASELSEEDAMKLEANLIVKYKSNNLEFGYNVQKAGARGNLEALAKHNRDTSKMLRCNQTGVIYPSIKEAARQTGICSSNVWKSYKYGNVYKGLSFSCVCDEILDEDLE